jgi:hypothetical protein
MRIAVLAVWLLLGKVGYSQEWLCSLLRLHRPSVVRKSEKVVQCFIRESSRQEHRFQMTGSHVGMDEGTEASIDEIFPEGYESFRTADSATIARLDSVKRDGLFYTVWGVLNDNRDGFGTVSVSFNAYEEPILIISNCAGIGSESTPWNERKGWRPMKCQ